MPALCHAQPSACPPKLQLLYTAALSSCLFAASARAADTAAQLSVDDVLGAKSILSLEVSPDGQWYAYSICDPAEENPRPWVHATGCSAWVQRQDEARPRRVSEGMGIELSWSPDGRYLAYQAYEGQELKLWIWDREQASARQVSDLRLAWFGQISQPVAWLPDGRQVLVKYAQSGGKYASESSAVEARLPPWARQPSGIKAKVLVTGAMLPQQQGVANTSIVSDVGLALVDIETGSHRVLYPAKDITGARLSPDGTKVAYTVRTGDTDERYGSYQWDLGVLEVASGHHRLLAHDIFQYHGMNFSWSPDGKRIAYLSGPSEPEFIEERGVPGARLIMLDADGSGRRTFGGELRMGLSGFWAPYWTCDASAVFVAAEDGLWKAETGKQSLDRVAPLEGFRTRQLVVGGGVGYTESQYRCGADRANDPVHLIARDLREVQDVWLRVQRDGSVEVTPLGLSSGDWSFHVALLADGGKRLLTMAQAIDKPVEVIELAPDGQVTTLTAFNHGLSRYTYGSLRTIEFDGPSGKLSAAVLLPPGFREGRRYPAILEMYPGTPMSVSASRSFGLSGIPMANAHLLSSHGYVVMVFDSQTREGTLSHDIVAAANAAADEIVRRGWADPERLGMRGCSHAGYAVLATLTQTDRFKAGVAECAFADVGNFWGYGWKHFIQHGIGKLMVPPWEDPDRYVEHSPYYHADRITTPLMLVVGAEDKGFVQQSEQMYRALDELGREAVLVTYEGEGHGIFRPENVKDFWQRLLAFFDAKLKYE